MGNIISVKNLRKSFGELEVLKGINLSVEKGEILGIIGISGAGKSTLVRCLNRLEVWDDGLVCINGEDIGRMTEKELNLKRQKIGMIFQQFNLLFSKDVYENIALPLRYLKRSKQEIDCRVKELLQIVGLADKIHAYPSQLSGGQKQRVAIARALASNPEILLSDEATSALDPDTTASILQLLKKLNRELGLTIIIITHEMEVVRETCDRIAVMDSGVIIEFGKTRDIFSNPQKEITKRFITSLFKTEAGDDLLRNTKIREKMGENGILVRLSVDDGIDAEYIIELANQFAVSAHVVYGNVGMVEDQPFGNLYIVLNGDKESVRQAAAWINRQNKPNKSGKIQLLECREVRGGL